LKSVFFFDADGVVWTPKRWAGCVTLWDKVRRQTLNFFLDGKIVFYGGIFATMVALEKHNPVAVPVFATGYGVGISGPFFCTRSTRLLFGACCAPVIQASRIFAEIDLNAVDFFWDAELCGRDVQ
jgi:hypothetical protein